MISSAKITKSESSPLRMGELENGQFPPLFEPSPAGWCLRSALVSFPPPVPFRCRWWCVPVRLGLFCPVCLFGSFLVLAASFVFPSHPWSFWPRSLRLCVASVLWFVLVFGSLLWFWFVKLWVGLRPFSHFFFFPGEMCDFFYFLHGMPKNLVAT